MPTRSRRLALLATALLALASLGALAPPAAAETSYQHADSLIAGVLANPTALVRSADGATLYLAGEADPEPTLGGLQVLRHSEGRWRVVQTFTKAGTLDYDGRVHLQLSADGRFLYAALQLGGLQVFAVAGDGRLTFVGQNLGLYADQPLALLQGQQPAWLYVGMASGIAAVRLDLQTGLPLAAETVDETGIADLARSKDGQYLIAVGNPAVRLFSVRNGLPLRVSSLDDVRIESSLLHRAAEVTTTRESAEFYVYGVDESADPDHTFVAILRIVANDQLEVVGEDRAGLFEGSVVSALAISENEDRLLVASEAHGNSYLQAFEILPSGFLGEASELRQGRLGHNIGARVLLATAGADFLATGFIGYPLTEVGAAEDQQLTLTRLLAPMVEPLSLAVNGREFYAGTRRSMQVAIGGREGLGLTVPTSAIDGGFSAAITDIAVNPAGNAIATLSASTGHYNVLVYQSLPPTGALGLGGSAAISTPHAGLAWSPDGNFLYAGPAMGWRVGPDRFDRLPGPEPIAGAPEPSVARVRISAGDGRRLYYFHRDPGGLVARLFERDTATGALTEIHDAAALAALEGAVDVAFSWDGRHVYVLRLVASDMVLDVLRWDEEEGRHELIASHQEAGLFHTHAPLPELVMEHNSRFLFFASHVDGRIAVYDRQPGTGNVIFRGNLQLPGFVPGLPLSEISLAAGPTGELYAADQQRGRVDLFRRVCEPGDARNLCLGENNRFIAEIDWQTAQGEHGYARQVEGAPPSSSGLFYFFSDNNWEALVKVLDACALNDRFWVFAATTTNVAYQLRVTDTLTGLGSYFSQDQGEVIPAITDTDALPACLGTPAPAPEALLATDRARVAAAAPAGGEVLHLEGFDVELRWKTPAGLEGTGQVVPFQSANSGIFTFFSPENWETQVKVLDGCAINGHHWLFAAAPTDVGFTLDVRRLADGARRSWTSPAGAPAPAIIDTEAFACLD